jgi:hypothetical protein
LEEEVRRSIKHPMVSHVNLSLGKRKTGTEREREIETVIDRDRQR